MINSTIPLTQQNVVLTALEQKAEQIDYEQCKIAVLDCMVQIYSRKRSLLNTNLNEAELQHLLLFPVMTMICSALGCCINLDRCKNREFCCICSGRSEQCKTTAMLTAVKPGTDMNTVVSQTMQYYGQIKKNEPHENIKVGIFLSEKCGEISFTFILFPFKSAQYLMLPEYKCTPDKMDAALELIPLLTEVNYELIESPCASSESNDKD